MHRLQLPDRSSQAGEEKKQNGKAFAFLRFLPFLLPLVFSLRGLILQGSL
jgi:hypothetical protein